MASQYMSWRSAEPDTWIPNWRQRAREKEERKERERKKESNCESDKSDTETDMKIGRENKERGIKPGQRG